MAKSTRDLVMRARSRIGTRRSADDRLAPTTTVEDRHRIRVSDDRLTVVAVATLGLADHERVTARR